jgi:hypothetical protein
MEPEGSLPHSQEPATCPYPEHIYVDMYIYIYTHIYIYIYVTPEEWSWRYKVLGCFYLCHISDFFLNGAILLSYGC